MPSSCSKVVRKQPPKSTAQPATPQRREQPALRVVASLSPVISDGTTTEADLCNWADSFARFHTNPAELHVPVALRTVDCPVLARFQQAGGPATTRTLRCVREVAKCNSERGIEWTLATWVPGLPGVRFQSCASYDAALTALDAPPQTVSFLADSTPSRLTP